MSNASTASSIDSAGPASVLDQYREWMIAPAESGEPIQQGERARRTWQTVSSPSLGKRLFVKRSGTEVENFEGSNKAGLPANRRPRWKESLLNEVRAIEYVRENIPSIPVPNIICHFEDRGCYYVIEEYVEGAISADAVPVDKYHLIIEQLQEVSRTLRQHRRSKCESFTGRPFLPARFMHVDTWLANADLVEDKDAFVLCHGDLASFNVFVHPETYKIVCIIDWEYASFLPEEIVEVWPRRGPVNCSFDDDPRDIDVVVNKLYHLARPGRPPRSNRRPDLEPDPIWKSVIPGKPAWDQTILPMPSWIELDRTYETPLQKRLRNLDIGLPGTTVTSMRSLDLHLVMTCRMGVASALESIADDMVYDYKATTDFLREMCYEIPNLWLLGGPRPPVYHEMMHLHELSSILPQIMRDLGMQLNISGLEFSRFRQHFINRDETQAFLPSNKSAALMDVHFRQTERRRWIGWMKASVSIMRVAHVALKLIESLPFDYGTYKEERTFNPPRPIPDETRERYEARAEAILGGSRAGLIPTMHDAFDRSHNDPLAMLQEPYHAKIKRRFTVGHGMREQYQGLQSSVYPHQGVYGKPPFRPRDMPWPPQPGMALEGVVQEETRPRRQSDPASSRASSERNNQRSARQDDLGSESSVDRQRVTPPGPVTLDSAISHGRVPGGHPRSDTRWQDVQEHHSPREGDPTPLRGFEKRGMSARIKEMLQVKSKLNKKTRDGRSGTA